MEPIILIVEDDGRIASLVQKNLEAAGYVCHVARDGESGWDRYRELSPSLLVLDVMLPGMDGLELTRRIRRDSAVPILMLTARSAEGDKVLGLEIGADDYLTKPFGTRELVARVRALLRRTSGDAGAPAIELNTLKIDPERREVVLSGTLVPTTTLEFDVLYLLASHPGRVYTRERLMARVWGEDRVVDPRSIDSVISRLRRKLTSADTNVSPIETVWGSGYRLVEPSG